MMLIDPSELAKWQTPNTDRELHDVLSRMEKTMRAQETPAVQRKRRLEDKKKFAYYYSGVQRRSNVAENDGSRPDQRRHVLLSGKSNRT